MCILDNEPNIIIYDHQENVNCECHIKDKKNYNR
jgi:hypothetical protein